MRENNDHLLAGAWWFTIFFFSFLDFWYSKNVDAHSLVDI